MNHNGYPTKEYHVPIKRYCRYLELRNDPELIAKYRDCHSKANSWPEIRQGIREVGILEMEIYIFANHLFMIVETPIDFDWDEAMDRLSTLPRQQEWENYVAVFQDCKENSTGAEKWQMMERMFYLYEE